MVDLIEKEWRQDSIGETALDEAAFFVSFFELTDIWTPDIDGHAYAEFLTRLFRRITVKKAREHNGPKATKIKPKIVVKVLNKELKVSQMLGLAPVLQQFHIGGTCTQHDV